MSLVIFGAIQEFPIITVAVRVTVFHLSGSRFVSSRLLPAPSQILRKSDIFANCHICHQ
jgi:hypothetical protein